MNNKFIINTEFFLECHGSCSGCFLTSNERITKATNYLNIFEELKNISKDYAGVNFGHLVIGFGRGNLLSMSENQLIDLLNLMVWCENNFSYEEITFEVSTSLIGKIDAQIIVANFLISKNRHIYFNIVINSEIVSKNFWSNLSLFYSATSNVRKSWGMVEDWGDIVVLNVNPEKLPELGFIKEFVKDHRSPINISVFPYDKSITLSSLQNLDAWATELWDILREKDFNVKNYFEVFYSFDFPYHISEVLKYHRESEGRYIFVDKDGKRTKGMPSIMGEENMTMLKTREEVENWLKTYESKNLTEKLMEELHPMVGIESKKKKI